MNHAVIGRLLVLQKDSTGYVEPCIAHTQWGDIPSKCKGGTCWIPYGGKEQIGNNFELILGTDAAPIMLVPNAGGVAPPGTVAGVQYDGAGQLFAAVADTQWGAIPGKAQGNTCWFPYGGKEQTTSKFSWIVRIHNF